MNKNKLIDLVMFRETSPDTDGTHTPKVTTGSIVWGIILRSFIIIIASIILIPYYELYTWWWVSLLVLWGLVAWPAYHQYTTFSQKMEHFEETTLCGSCRYFDPSNQLCTLLDEHTTEDYIPCGGDSWEPKAYEDR